MSAAEPPCLPILASFVLLKAIQGYFVACEGHVLPNTPALSAAPAALRHEKAKCQCFPSRYESGVCHPCNLGLAYRSSRPKTHSAFELAQP